MNDQDLQQLIEHISLKFFNKPFIGGAKFNHRLRTTGGRYIPAQRLIEINPKYLTELGEEELIGIIKHELCHYHPHVEGKPYHHRSQEFRTLMKKVDAPRFCTILPSEEDKRYLLYQCIKCKMTYRRKRKINVQRYRCGKCRGSLKLIK
ncbi:SprT family protein [Piscibacillus halophilus]|uniref:SprT family protein n=1 Tax=Piscibacillus halophilus TaxID=571933 RepID=UPI00158830D9|nr:SprT family protein [Piscibacillus halophilus]